MRTADEELTGVITAADADGDVNGGDGGGLVGIEIDGVERCIALEDITEAQMVVAGLDNRATGRGL